MANELALNAREQNFVENLLNNGGNVQQAAKDAGYEHPQSYGYVLRKRLAKEIAEATQQYLAFHGPKAAHKVISLMDDEMPNPIHLAAAKDILDRSGVKTPDQTNQISVKANIFILPEKRLLEEAKIIDTEYSEPLESLHDGF